MRIHVAGGGPRAVLLVGILTSVVASPLALCGQQSTGPAPVDGLDGPSFQAAAPLGPVIAARPGEGAVLDLQGCVQEVLKANDLLRAERLKRDELGGQMYQALSNGLPTLDLVGSWSRSRDPSFALDSTFGGSDTFGSVPGADPWFDDFLAGFGSLIPEPGAIPAQSFLTTNLSLFWELNFSKILGAVGAARLGINRQDLAQRAVEQATVQSTLKGYHDIIKAAERIAAVKAQLANQTELLAIMRLRNELGLATSLDTLQAAVSLANVRPQLRIAEANLRNTGSRLNVLMGRRPEAPISIANQVALELEPVQESAALELALGRPEIAANATFVDILRRNRQAQKADKHPYLTVSGSYGYVGKTVDTLFDPGHDSWRAAVALNVPVFDGLLTRGLVSETEARILRTTAELDAQRKDVQLEVLELLANLGMAKDVLAAVQLNLQRSEEAMSESLLSLRLGTTSYLDVLVAEANRAEAQANLIDARFEVVDLTASLKRALGYSPLLALSEIPGLVGEVAR
jgi:outer membrane protein TolC